MAAFSPLRPTLPTGTALAAALVPSGCARGLLETLRRRTNVVAVVKRAGGPSLDLSTSVPSTAANEGRS